MSNWKQQLAATLEAGKKPSYEQLEIALQGALEERNQFEVTVKDMATWLARLTTAHLHGDGSSLPTEMVAFIAQRVKVQVQEADGTTTVVPPQAATSH